MKTQPKSVSCELCISRKFSLFSGVADQHLCHISDNKNFISHKKGQILFYEGTKPLGVFCINEGVVKVYKTASNGKEQIIRLAKKGDFLGYTSLLGEEAYTSSATIVEEAKICFIPRESFLKVLADDNAFQKRVTKAICHDLGIMEEKLTDATQKSIRERLAFTLLMLCENYGIDGQEGQKIDIVLTREEIAGLVGTATETVIRLLSEFKKDELIEFDGKKIIVLDKKAIARLSDFYG